MMNMVMLRIKAGAVIDDPIVLFTHRISSSKAAGICPFAKSEGLSVTLFVIVGSLILVFDPLPSDGKVIVAVLPTFLPLR